MKRKVNMKTNEMLNDVRAAVPTARLRGESIVLLEPDLETAVAHSRRLRSGYRLDFGGGPYSGRYGDWVCVIPVSW
ncbi:MAG: hypothetical protein MN733_27865 [Nitrososphaera sp.]|nr:hypothetical protein [Nitrososphaera sp.]